MTARGSIWWADLGEPRGSGPGKRRPVLVISADNFNVSSLQTVVVVTLTSNTGLSARPGNVFLPATTTGLPRDSTVNVTSLYTVDKADLLDEVGVLTPVLLADVDRGLRLALDL